MNSIASLPQDGTVDRTLAASYNVLEQAPPPTLREILGAYKAKGDGDRDLLMAMLNAKSAEDQRLASVAALQRTMLEIHQAHSVSATVTESPARAAHPSPLGNSRYDYGMASPGYEHRHLPERSPRSVYRSPPTDAEYNHHPYSSSHRRSHAHQSTREYHPEPHTYSHSTTQSASTSRKRVRAARSPNPALTPSPHDLPPSPYSSASESLSAIADSPRSRGAMDIGSLISSHSSHTGSHSYSPPDRHSQFLADSQSVENATHRRTGTTRNRRDSERDIS